MGGGGHFFHSSSPLYLDGTVPSSCVSVQVGTLPVAVESATFLEGFFVKLMKLIQAMVAGGVLEQTPGIVFGILPSGQTLCLSLSLCPAIAFHMQVL